MSNDSEDTQDVGVGAPRISQNVNKMTSGSCVSFASPYETLAQYAKRTGRDINVVGASRLVFGGRLQPDCPVKIAAMRAAKQVGGGVQSWQNMTARNVAIWAQVIDKENVGEVATDIFAPSQGMPIAACYYKFTAPPPPTAVSGVDGVPAFVPRQITRVKPYAYQVRKNDTLATIAGAFGVGAERIPELVGANMEGRPLRPLRLGAPSRAMTLAGLSEGETLRIPARWPDPQWASGMVGDPVDMNSALAQGMNLAMQTMQASNQIPTLPKDQASTALATAMAWFANANGPAPALNPMDYTAFIANAVNWITQIALPVSQAPSGPSIAQLGMFPWGPLATMLNAGNNPYATANWAGMIPGSPSVPWSILPWDLLAKNASILNLGQGIGPITWPMPSQVNPGTVRMSFMDAAQLQPECPAGQFRDPATGACMNVCPPVIDGKPVVYHPESNSCVIATPIATSCPQGQTHADPQDDTSPCVDICAGQPGTFYSAATGKCEPVCPYGYDPNTKMCKPAPTGGDPGSGNTTNQAPAVEKKSSTMTAVLAVGAVAAAGGLIWWATRGKKSAPSAG